MLVDILGRLVATNLVIWGAFFAVSLFVWHDAPKVPLWADVVFTVLVVGSFVGAAVYLLLVIWGF